MIRFVDLGTQLCEMDEEHRFAFYNTISDHFEMFSGSQTWESWADFEQDAAGLGTEGLLRYKFLCQEWVFKPPI